MALSKYVKEELACTLAEECAKATAASKDLLEATNSCYLMETLAVLAACCQDDPSLRSSPADKFEHLTTPESFKASLFQVVATVKEFFVQSQESMTSISDNLEDIPLQMNNILSAINMTESSAIKAQLNLGLINLKSIASTCKKYAELARNKCVESRDIIVELAVFSLATKGRIEKDQHNAELEINALTLRKKNQELRFKEIKQLVEDQEKTVKDAVKDFEDKMKESDGFFHIFGLILIDSMLVAVETAAMLYCPYLFIGHMFNKIDEVADLVREEIRNSKLKKGATTDEIVSFVFVTSLSKSLRDVIKDKAEDKTDKQIKEDIDLLNSCLKQESKATTDEAKIGIDNVKTLLKILEKSQKQNITSQETAEWKREFNYAVPAIEVFVSVYSTKAGEVKKDDFSKVPDGHRVLLLEAQTNTIRTMERRALFEQTLAEMFRKDKNETQAKLKETIASLDNLKAEDTKFAHTLVFLKNAIDHLNDMSDAWEHLINYFTLIERSIDTDFLALVKTLVNKSNALLSEGHADAIIREIMAKAATKACVIAAVLMQSSTLFLEISDKFITPILDETLKDPSLEYEKALELKATIKPKFNEINGEIKAKIDEFNKAVKDNVLKTLADHGFNLEGALQTRSYYFLN